MLQHLLQLLQTLPCLLHKALHHSSPPNHSSRQRHSPPILEESARKGACALEPGALQRLTPGTTLISLHNMQPKPAMYLHPTHPPNTRAATEQTQASSVHMHCGFTLSKNTPWQPRTLCCAEPRAWVLPLQPCIKGHVECRHSHALHAATPCNTVHSSARRAYHVDNQPASQPSQTCGMPALHNPHQRKLAGSNLPLVEERKQE